jgi:hypothetical protein
LVETFSCSRCHEERSRDNPRSSSTIEATIGDFSFLTYPAVSDILFSPISRHFPNRSARVPDFLAPLNMTDRYLSSEMIQKISTSFPTIHCHCYPIEHGENGQEDQGLRVYLVSVEGLSGQSLRNEFSID